MFREDPLVRLGIVLMSIALVIIAAALVASLTLRDRPELADASETDKAGNPAEVVRSDVSGKAPWAEEEPEPPEPEVGQKEPEAKPEPEQQALPVVEADWPEPSREEIEAANGPRRYDLPRGAIMGLTMEAIGIYNAPVWNTDSQWALDNGVVHVPETSLPWSNTPQRNVYLAGHRLGYEGTGSRLIFYNLGELQKGDRIVLEDRRGRTYEYEVSEVFVVGPYDSWVMGQVRDRDMVTLQTCTPIPTFDKRLIVRADRV